MEKVKQYLIILILLSTILFSITQVVTAEEDDITLEFFYMHGCGLCNKTKPVINETEEQYNQSVTFIRYLVASKSSENYTLFNETYGLYSVPAIVISNQTTIHKINATQIYYSNDIKKDIETSLTPFLPPIIVLEYFYGPNCGECEITTPIINQVEEVYLDQITVKKYPVDPVEYPENYNKMKSHGLSFPSAVILNTLNGRYSYVSNSDRNLTYENLVILVDYHLEGDYSEKSPETEKNTELCFFGLFCIDTDDYSLPVLTIALGLLDSLNPCSFFIFLVLLSILIHMQSRKRMFLVAGIFIFVSGAFYFLLMTTILNVYAVIEQTIIISTIAGIIAIVFGCFNIKDFFLFKQGPSLSVSEEKKSKIYKQIRKVAKMPYLTGLIAYTILLAISVNTIELICSLIVPVIYTDILHSYNLTPFQNYMYIFFYNILYVIPLIILVIIFGILQKQWKLSEWQGRCLKLYSGILILSLGLILIIDPHLLKNGSIALILVLIDLIVAYLISIVMKKVLQKRSKELT